MAIATKCQTPGTQYNIRMSGPTIEIVLRLPEQFHINPFNEEMCKELEGNIHNALELALAPLFNGTAS